MNKIRETIPLATLVVGGSAVFLRLDQGPIPGLSHGANLFIDAVIVTVFVLGLLWLIFQRRGGHTPLLTRLDLILAVLMVVAVGIAIWIQLIQPSLSPASWICIVLLGAACCIWGTILGVRVIRKELSKKGESRHVRWIAAGIIGPIALWTNWLLFGGLATILCLPASSTDIQRCLDRDFRTGSVGEAVKH